MSIWFPFSQLAFFNLPSYFSWFPHFIHRCPFHYFTWYCGERIHYTNDPSNMMDLGFLSFNLNNPLNFTTATHKQGHSMPSLLFRNIPYGHNFDFKTLYVQPLLILLLLLLPNLHSWQYIEYPNSALFSYSSNHLLVSPALDPCSVRVSIQPRVWVFNKCLSN